MMREGDIANAGKTPEETCGLFQRFMAEGDLDCVLSVYDAEAVFLKESRETTQRRGGIARSAGAARRSENQTSILK